MLVTARYRGSYTRPFQNGWTSQLFNAAFSLVESLVLTQMLAADWLLGATVLERITGLLARDRCAAASRSALVRLFRVHAVVPCQSIPKESQRTGG